MQAIVNAPEKKERVDLCEVDEPVPEPGEALIVTRASSINRGELTLLAHRPAGWRPGQDVAGVVEEAAADGSGPRAGTRVVGLVEGGGWSQRVAVRTDRLAVLPPEVSVEQAATLPIAGLTALRILRRGGPLLGARVLVTGANGAVGRFAVELADRSGAHVVAVSSRRDQADALRGLGAEDVVETVEAAGGEFDLILESVGGPVLTAAVARVRRGGTVVVYGASSGQKAELNVYDFLGGHEQASLVNYMSYASDEPVDRDLAVLVGEIARDRLHPTIGFSADWTRLVDALSTLEDRSIVGGKAVITVP